MSDVISISEARFNNMVLVKCWPDSLEKLKNSLRSLIGAAAPQVGQFTETADQICACLSPGHYMIFSNEPIKCDFQADICAVTDVSHARAGLHLSGEKIYSLLNKGLAIDLEELPVHSALQSSIHSIAVIVLKLNSNEFVIFTYSSFFESFYDWVIDSAKEYGYAPE